MQKPNSLMAIRRINLDNKKYLEELISSLTENLDPGEEGQFVRTRICCEYDNLYLIDLENKGLYHQYDDYNIDAITEHFTAEEIYNNRDNYFLFIIEWMDNTCKFELEEYGMDSIFNLDDFKYLKNFNNYPKKITGIKDKQFVVERIRGEYTDDYYILGFYANGWKDEWTGEYNACFDFCGIIDMNKIEVIKENEDAIEI